MEIALVKRLEQDEDDRAYLAVGGQTRRGPVRVEHDLPHLVVESVFEINDGLWGELAAGQHGTAGQATSARDPKRRKSGRIVSGAAGGARTEQWLNIGHRVATAAANAVVNRCSDGPDTPAGVRERLARQPMPKIDALLARVTDEQIVTAIQDVRSLHRRRAATPPAGTLRLTWPLYSSASEESVDEWQTTDGPES